MGLEFGTGEALHVEMLNEQRLVLVEDTRNCNFICGVKHT